MKEAKIEYDFTIDDTVCAIEEMLTEHGLRFERRWDDDRLYLKIVKEE